MDIMSTPRGYILKPVCDCSMHKTNYISNAHITHALFCRSAHILKFPVMRTLLIVTKRGDFKQPFLKKKTKTKQKTNQHIFIALFPALETDGLYEIMEEYSTKSTLLRNILIPC